MHWHMPEMAEVLSRLERVENENRRMKRAALGVIALAGSVFLMGLVGPSTAKTIEAENFVVKDASGKVRAVFGMNDSDRGGASLILGSDGAQAAREKYVVRLHGGDYAWLNMTAGDDSEDINAVINSDNGPELLLDDKKGYKTDIGQTDLVTTRTGETHRTSSASIVMYGKDKHLIWSAP